MANLFRGVYVPLATPMTDEQEVDFDALQSLAGYLIEAGGVHGLMPLGSTGEYYALNDSEKAGVVDAVIEADGGRVPVLVGTNSGRTREVIRLSQQAEEKGAAGILLAPPYYSLPTPDELYDHFATVNNAIGIPIMLYNYPARTGVDLTPDLVERLSTLENIRYIKESTGDSSRVSNIILRCGSNIEVFCGSDAIAFESLMLGAVGWVAGVGNVLPKEHVDLFNLIVELRDYSTARELYYRLLPLLQCMEGGGKYTQFVKAACAAAGRPIGPPRKPLLEATEDEKKNIARLVSDITG